MRRHNARCCDGVVGDIALPRTVAAPQLGAQQLAQHVDRGAGVGKRLQLASPGGADPPEMPHQQRPPEQVRPDLQTIVPELIPFGTNASERHLFREQLALLGPGRHGAHFGEMVMRWLRNDRLHGPRACRQIEQWHLS